MFEQSLLLGGPASRWPMISSMMLQVTGVCALLVVPLIWWEQLPPVLPLPPQLFMPRSLPPMQVFKAGLIRSTAPRLTTPQPFRAPVQIPSSVNMKPRNLDGGQEPILAAGPGSIPGAPDGLFSNPLGKLQPPTVPAEPKSDPPKAAAATAIRVSSGLQASKLIYQIKPPYPPLARQTHTQGVVKLHAIIGRDGSIQQLQVLAGHPLLVQAAVDAVRQWRYSPTLLNGQPVEVVTQIDVNFTLGR